MKIVVNTRLLRKGQMDGIGWFTFNTLKYIVRNNPDIEFHFLFDSGVDEEFLFAENVKPVNLFPPAKHAVLNIIWFEWSVKRYLQKVNPDLFISMDGILSLGWKGKQFAVIYDINFVHIPKDLKWSNRKYYNYFFPRNAKQAARIATISEYSKKDLVNTYHVNPGKIDIVYCGINDFFHPVSEEVKKQTREKYAEGQEYFIFIGTLHPRKNILRLLEAFEVFKQETGSPMKLLIVGKSMYKTNEMLDFRNKMVYGKDVLFLGRKSDVEVNDLLASALALTFVPYYEGFGIPLLEAMQCHVPVISSNLTSMPEVVGDAGFLVDPYDVISIRNAMIKMANSPVLRQELIRRGIKRKEHFSWERTAHLLWKSIGKVF